MQQSKFQTCLLLGLLGGGLTMVYGETEIDKESTFTFFPKIIAQNPPYTFSSSPSEANIPITPEDALAKQAADWPDHESVFNRQAANLGARDDDAKKANQGDDDGQSALADQKKSDDLDSLDHSGSFDHSGGLPAQSQAIEAPQSPDFKSADFPADSSVNPTNPTEEKTNDETQIIETPPADQPTDAVAPQIAQTPPQSGKMILETAEKTPAEKTLAENTTPKISPKKEFKEILTKQIVVRPGDTLSMILTGAGVREQDTQAAVIALKNIYDPKQLKSGHIVDLTLEGVLARKDKDHQGLRLQKATIQTTPLRTVTIERQGLSFLTSILQQQIERQERRLSGVIFNSLSQAAHRAKVPAAVISEMIDAYSYDIDFQRDIRREDRFAVMYEEDFIGDQPVPGTARLIHASLELSGQRSQLYRFRPAQGEDGFYDEHGQGIRKALLRTPVNGARLSSRYGMRKHPILGYNRMHRGVDFAAPKGTPIYAAGNGTVRKAHYNGNYGHYIEIKHNKQFSTAYAHLSRYAKGVKAGSYVRQGQIIGYVGSTGLSSGPHLHFEVRRNNKSINPLSVRLPAAEKLSGDDLQLFEKRIADIQRRYDNLEEKTEIVSRQ